MPRFRKKPVVITAVLWDGNMETVMRELGTSFPTFGPPGQSGSLRITTLEGDHECRLGDWIIRGVKGEFYPCKPDIFEMTYEQVVG